MNVTRDVIRDLLPVYYSGEASSDTKSLVDDFLAKDESFATLVRDGERAASQLDAANDTQACGVVSGEAAAFNATKRALKRRTTYLAGALLFTVWPVSFSFGDAGVAFVFKDAPAVALTMWIVAGVLWAAYAGQRRRTRNAGI
jgi:hypothetical protein